MSCGVPAAAVITLCAAAETAPGNDSPCSRGRSVPVTDLSNGDAQYCIVLCRVAVVTGGESTSTLQKRFCWELKCHCISDLSVCVADCAAIYRHWDTHRHSDRPAMKEAVGFHVFVAIYSPALLTCFSQSTLKCCPIFGSVESHISGDQMQFPGAAIQACCGSYTSACYGPNLYTHASGDLYQPLLQHYGT